LIAKFGGKVNILTKEKLAVLYNCMEIVQYPDCMHVHVAPNMVGVKKGRTRCA
jgi:hypothetical protein